MMLAFRTVAPRIPSGDKSSERCLEGGGNEAVEGSAGPCRADTGEVVTVVEDCDPDEELEWECKKRDGLRGRCGNHGSG